MSRTEVTPRITLLPHSTWIVSKIGTHHFKGHTLLTHSLLTATAQVFLISWALYTFLLQPLSHTPYSNLVQVHKWNSLGGGERFLCIRI
jgi:hypothetical protein